MQLLSSSYCHQQNDKNIFFLSALRKANAFGRTSCEQVYAVLVASVER